MEIRFSYPMWGSAHLPLETFFQKIKEQGYHGVEMGIRHDTHTSQLQPLLKKYDLRLIAQQAIHDTTLSAKEYTLKMEAYLYRLASFEPQFINSHTGRDFYSFEENCKIFELAEDVARNTGVTIFHETHRGRALFCTSNAQRFFNTFPELKITADFSHWCCVSESLLHEQQVLMEEAIQRSRYIHARVGNEQSPQITHPAAPEHTDTVNIHLSWWHKIVESMHEKGNGEIWMCTEFGPPPYLQTLPFSNQVVADQFEINLHMKKLIENTLVNLPLC